MKISKEVQISLVAIAAIVVLFFGMQFLKGQHLFSTDNTYYIKFKNVSGLSASCPIFANGYKVGVVERIDYDYASPEDIVAVVAVNREMKLPQGTVAEIASDVLGNVKLQLLMGSMSAGIMAVGDTLDGGIEKGTMGKAADLIPQIGQMLPKLDSILSSVNHLLADPSVGNTLHNVEQITSDLTATTTELQHLSANLNRQVPSMLTKADTMLGNTEQLTRNLSQVDVAAMMDKVNATLVNVEQMTSALNSKDGTLGLLMRDASLYSNLNATMSHADSLMIDLKSHPKRYVHFSIFGKKDK